MGIYMEGNSNKRVWKFGSRWSENGTYDSCIADTVFNRYNIAFSYTHAVLDANAGDLIALANGWTIVAIGEILSQPDEIKNLSIKPTPQDQKNYFDDENVCGCIVHYHWLSPADRFEYCRRGKFCHAPQIADRVNSLFKKYNALNNSNM